MRWIFLPIVLCGCMVLGPSKPLPLTETELAYPISKAEPGPQCKMVGGFFGYDSPCRNDTGAIPDLVQFSCIRKEITKAGGNYGVLDAVVGAGWYKGRTFWCPDALDSEESGQEGKMLETN